MTSGLQYKLVLPFDNAFFETCQERGITEAYLLVTNEKVNKYDINRFAYLTALDIPNATLLEARHFFYYGEGDTDDSQIREKKLRDAVENMAEDQASNRHILVKIGRFVMSEDA